MLGFFGYNFYSDGNTLDPYPTAINNIQTIKIENAIYDGFYMTKDVVSEYSTDVPTDWDLYTIMLAQFENSLTAGNLDALIDQLNSIRIKRRKLGTFDWITIKEIPVNAPEDVNFIGEDLLAMNDTVYEYAWVPVLNDIEGNYITAQIESKFNGVFIADADTIFKFYAGVSYGGAQKVQQIGVFNPLNRKYPIYVANGALDYMTGSITGRILGNYETTHELNRKEMVEQRDALLNFLTNKKAKLIKDFNGNQWLVFIIDSPSVSFDTQWGNGMMDVGFDWSEVGDPDKAEDLQNVGLVPIV